MRRRVGYDDVTRCHECAENIPLLVSALPMMAKLRYECGHCATELDVKALNAEAPAYTNPAMAGPVAGASHPPTEADGGMEGS